MSASELKFSNETLDILKNLSQINNSIAFKKGTKLETISESSTVFAIANITEEIPRDFCIYDLSQLLGTLALPTLADGSAIMSDDKEFMVLIGSGGTKAKYWFTNAEFVTVPEKEIVMPPVDVSVHISAETMESFMKACAILDLKMVKFRNTGKMVQLVGTTGDVEQANDYIVDLRKPEDGEAEFGYLINVEYFSKLIEGSYDVSISSVGISKFENRDIDILYYIGIETN
ncbi:MAG: hypothetical protein KAS32_23225 [Candidatus Peribacteraceae bacterium]|nr:hypothetical protein [Candidatus Peribacteraceae bacterium]